MQVEIIEGSCFIRFKDGNEMRIVETSDSVSVFDITHTDRADGGISRVVEVNMVYTRSKET